MLPEIKFCLMDLLLFVFLYGRLIMKKFNEEEFENKLKECEQLLINGGQYNSSELLVYVENLINNHPHSISNNVWYKYLYISRFPDFLRNLNGREERYR